MTKLAFIVLLLCLCASCKTESVVHRTTLEVEVADIPQRSVARTNQLIVVPSQPMIVFTWEYLSNISNVAYFQFYQVTNLSTGGRYKAFKVPAPNLTVTIPMTNQMGFYVVTTVGHDGYETGPNTK